MSVCYFRYYSNGYSFVYLCSHVFSFIQSVCRFVCLTLSLALSFCPCFPICVHFAMKRKNMRSCKLLPINHLSPFSSIFVKYISITSGFSIRFMQKLTNRTCILYVSDMDATQIAFYLNYFPCVHMLSVFIFCVLHFRLIFFVFVLVFVVAHFFYSNQSTDTDDIKCLLYVSSWNNPFFQVTRISTGITLSPPIDHGSRSLFFNLSIYLSICLLF